MKAILEFDLPEDKYGYMAARNGHSYLRALQDLSEWLRTQIKYAEPEHMPDIHEVREQLYTVLEENDVHLEAEE